MGEHSQKGQSELTNNQVVEKVSAQIPDFSASRLYYQNVDEMIQHISPSQKGEKWKWQSVVKQVHLSIKCGMWLMCMLHTFSVRTENTADLWDLHQVKQQEVSVKSLLCRKYNPSHFEANYL